MSDITVILDNQVRTVTAVLAASQWPAHEQTIAPHAVHTHSKQTKLHITPFVKHTAVSLANQYLSNNHTLADLFTAALTPAGAPLPQGITTEWPTALADFATQANLNAFWAEHNDVWQEAHTELTDIIVGSQVAPFLADLIGQPLPYPARVHPTVVYPMLEPVHAHTDAGLTLVLPPAKAWGESPPWPFGEDPGWVIGQLCWHLAAHYLADTLANLDATQQALLKDAAVTLCLQRQFDEAEGMSYMVRRKKEQKLPTLPLVVENMRDYLENTAGKTLADLV